MKTDINTRRLNAIRNLILLYNRSRSSHDPQLLNQYSPKCTGKVCAIHQADWGNGWMGFLGVA